MTHKQYPNPVHDVPKEDRKVVTVDIVKADWTLLKGCDLTHGSLTATFNILVNKLANECRQRGIIDFSKSTEFRELVQSVGFIPGDSIVVNRDELATLRGLRDSTPKRTPRKSDGRNVARRPSRKSDEDKATSNPAGLQSGSGSGDTSGEGQTVGS
jgi:hypothetical protein